MMQSLVLFSDPLHTYPDIWIRNFFFPDTAIFHTNLVNPADNSATFWIGSSEWKFLNMLWIRNIVWTLNSDIFLSGDITRLSPVLYRSWQARSQVLSVTRRCILQDVIFARFKTRAPLPIFPEESWVLEWIQIRIGNVWKEKFDLNTDTSRRGNFWNRKLRKSCGFKNIRMGVEGGLSLSCVYTKNSL